MNEIMAAPDKGIPEEVLNGAKCIAVVPDMAKGAFIVGGEHGRGVVTCRTAHGWSAPAFKMCIRDSVACGQVEDWRHAPQFQPIRRSLCSLGVPQWVNRPLVSNPRLVKPIAPIPSSRFICHTFKL